MPHKRTDGFAGRPFTPKARFARARALGRGSFNRLLVEQPLAAGADFSLDVIGNPAALPDSVDGDSVVLVPFEGHSLSSG
jgi:hypothetical protein